MYPGRAEKDIAELVGMTPDAFSRALNGKRGFAAVEVARLAELLGASMYWLATGERDPHEPVVVARHEFDRRTRSRSADWDAMKLVEDDVHLAYRQVNLPAWDQRVVPADPEEARAMLGPGAVRDLATRLEDVFGIDVIKIGGVPTALTMILAGRPVIVLGETGNWFYLNWSLAHEFAHLALGHVVADSHAPVDARLVDQQEADANAFAAEFLLPRTELLAIDWQKETARSVAARLWEWGVSTDALRTRLAALKCVLPAELSAALSLKTQTLLRRHWDGNTADDLITVRMEEAAARKFPLALRVAHIEAIAAGRVPKGTLAWMLDIDEADLEVDEPEAEYGDSIDVLAADLGLEVSGR